MMYVLQQDTSEGVPFPEVHSNFDRPRGFVTMGGPRIAHRLPLDLTFFVEDGSSAGGLTDFMRGVGFLIVSTRVKNLWEECAADVEYVSTTLVYRGQSYTGYFMANPLLVIRGIDQQRSGMVLDSVGVALKVKELVLVEEKFIGVPLAVLDETRHLVVSDALMAKMQERGLIGCSFTTPSSIRF